MYYACRAISTQPVTNMSYDDLIEITLVYVPAVLREGDGAKDLYIFAQFFAISSQEEADKFAEGFSSVELGKELISMYNNALRDVNSLNFIENAPYFTGRLSEAQLEEAKKKAEQKGLDSGMSRGMARGMAQGISQGTARGTATAKRELAAAMLAKNYPVETVAELIGLPQSEIVKMAPYSPQPLP